MNKINKLWNFSGSRNLSVYIFITGLVYVLFLVGFSAVIPAWWVNNLSKLLPFKVLYAIFFINLIICEIKWIPVVVRRCRKPEIPKTEEDLERFKHKREVQSSKFKIQSLARYLRKRGYRVRNAECGFMHPEGHKPQRVMRNVEKKDDIRHTTHDSRVLYAYRGRFSPVGNLLFHMSFLFLLAGVFVSMSYRYEQRVMLMEGQEYVPQVGEIKNPLDQLRFAVEDITPKFWKGELLFTYLGALISHDRGKEIAMLSSGVRMDGARVTIEGISYTPKYVLRELGGGVVDVGYVNLANFAPGSVDHFSIPGFPYKIYVSIYPDFEAKDRKVGTKSMNLSNPRCLVRVVRGKVPVYSGVLGYNNEAYFDGFGLSFPEIRYNGTFHIVRDPGEWLIWIAFILLGVGLVWKVLFYRREVAVGIFGDKIYLCLNSDYYPALFLKRYAALVKRHRGQSLLYDSALLRS